MIKFAFGKQIMSRVPQLAFFEQFCFVCGDNEWIGSASTFKQPCGVRAYHELYIGLVCNCEVKLGFALTGFSTAVIQVVRDFNRECTVPIRPLWTD